MSERPFPATESLTSEERWRRWEQRGRENDTRFQRRARTALIAAIAILGGGLLVAALLG